MKEILVIIVLVAIGWYGTELYNQSNSTLKFPATDLVKCITKEGKVVYGNVPNDVACEKTEPVKGSLTIVSTKPDNKTKSDDTNFNKESNSDLSFKCDGRTHCSQMTSCEEATFFINNCPNTKMDGNHDGIPCERQWCL